MKVCNDCEYATGRCGVNPRASWFECKHEDSTGYGIILNDDHLTVTNCPLNKEKGDGKQCGAK